MFRDNAYIHDSYHCKPRDRALFGKVHPYPTQRDGGYWIGSGPARADRIDKMKSSKCPLECRPSDHQEWENC